MNELITRLSSILNLPKAFAITAPGLVAALAIVLLAIPYGKNTESCLVTMLKGGQQGGPPPPPDAAGPEKRVLPNSCLGISVPRRELPPNADQNWRRSDVVDRFNKIRGCLADLDTKVVEERANSARLESQIAARQSDADAYQKQAQEYGKQANRDLESQMRTRSEAALDQVDRLKTQKQTLDQKVIVLSEERTRRTAERTELEGALRPKLPDGSGELKEDSSKVQVTFIDRMVASTTQTFLGILLLAGVIGLLLQPLNRAFLTGAIEPLVGVFNLFGGREVQQATKIKAYYLKLGRLEARVRTWKQVMKAAGAAGIASGSPVEAIVKAALDAEEKKARSARSVAYLNPQYAVGKGLISRDELDDADQRYLTQADVSGGMVLPLIALAVAFDVRTSQDCLPSAGWFGSAVLAVLVGVAALASIGCFTLWWRRRRYGQLERED